MTIDRSETLETTEKQAAEAIANDATFLREAATGKAKTTKHTKKERNNNKQQQQHHDALNFGSIKTPSRDR